MNKTRVIVIISLLFVAGIIGLGIWLYASNHQTPAPNTHMDVPAQDSQSSSDPSPNQEPGTDTAAPKDYSVDDINTYLIKNETGLVNSATNTPAFSIANSNQPLPGWYVVTLKNTAEETSNATVVLREVNGRLTTAAGPGTGIFNQTDLPPEVREAARRGLE